MAFPPDIPQEVGQQNSFTLVIRFSCNIIATDFSLFGGVESLSEGKPYADIPPRRTAIVNPNNLGEIYNGPPQDPSDFLWVMTEEPHRSRRKAIMQAHPEVCMPQLHPASVLCHVFN